MTICIFPGTFNPIHSGHLKMAEFAVFKYNFEKIIFIPSYIPPHKNTPKKIANHRYTMVKIATQSNNKFEVSDIEFQNEGKSYTILTVEKIRKQYNIKDKLSILIGTDAFKNIRSWYKVDELKNIAHFIVFQRNNDIINEKDFSDFDFEFAGMEEVSISSSEIRNSDINKTTDEVKEYIIRHELYN